MTKISNTKLILFFGFALIACGHIEQGDSGDASPAPSPAPSSPVACSSTVPATTTTTTFAAMPRNPGVMIGDATNLYFFDGDGLEKMPFAGGAKTTLVFGVLDNVWGLALDATNVYWANDAQIASVPIAGGAPTKIAVAPEASNGPPLLVSSSSIFWISYSATDATNVIVSAPLTGGAPTGVIKATSDALPAFTVDSQRLYWAESPGSDIPTSLNAMPLGGGAITTLATTSREVGARAMVTNGVDLFWTEDTAIKKVPVGGGSAIIIASGFDQEPTGLQVDAAGNVYWQRSYTGYFRASPTGDCVQELFKEQSDNFATAFVVGPQRFYFADDAAQTIDSVPR